MSYRREVQQGQHAPASSRFVWNEAMYRSFLAGYLKRLDWGLYTRLESPVAKRLYRFLDKRFYHGNRVEIDLRELAIQKVRLSEHYNVAQMKRALLKGIAELEERWELRRRDSEKRFVKEGTGRWTVILERRPQQKSRAVSSTLPTRAVELPSSACVAANAQSLVAKLTSRGIGPAVADELATDFPLAHVCTMIELHDWYNQRGQSRGPGFLVGAIKNPERIVFPKGFESSVAVEARKAAEKNRISSEREFRTQRQREHAKHDNSRQAAFLAFWRCLSPIDQEGFEREALEAADPTKRAGYLRSMGKGNNPILEQYRSIILRDHFERTHGLQPLSDTAMGNQIISSEAV